MKAATDKGTQTLLDKGLLRVLLVEDEATDKISVERILRTCSLPVEFVVESVVTLSEAIRNLAEKQYDVVLLDLELPDSSGIETLRQVVKVAPDIPVVVLTELDDEQTGFSVLEDGATDYLVKDLSLDVVLVRAIVYAMQRKKIQMQSLKLTHDVNERMKELNCLYGISKLVEVPGISLEEILEKTVCLIPAGWQYPGIACAKIVIGDSEFRTKNFTESAWKQSAPIKVSGSVMGKIEVGYLEERPELDDEPFLKEERLLIDAIAERLGHITERNKAEETQKRLVAIIEATPDFVGFADAKDKHIIYVNKAGRKMCGIGNDEDVTKLKISDVHPEWTNKMLAEEILPAAVRDGVWTGECAFLNIRDRHEMPVSMVLSSHKASNGEVELFSTISRDITERKQAEEALLLKENIIKCSSSAIATCDPEGNMTYGNPSFLKTWGFDDPDEFLGRSFWEIWLIKDRLNEIMQVLRSEGAWFGETKAIRKDGAIFDVQVSAAMVFDGRGNPVALTSTSMDITERKKAEETLRESEERYKNLFKANIDGILIADATTKKFRYANPAICRMLGYSEEEFMQMGVADIHPKESLEQVFAEFEAQTSGTKINADLQCVRKDGQVISVSINAGTVMLDQTKYLLGIFRDVTEFKNKEKLIMDANRRLEKVSEELSAAKRDLEQKNEALQKTCSELEQRVKEQTAELAAANKVLGVTQQNMHTVIKHSADGLLIVDDNKIVLFMNPSAEAILGRRAPDLLGEPFELPLTTDKPSEVQLVAADGSVTIAEVQAVRTEWENEPVHMATIRDITLRKKAQQETEAANEQLRKFNDLKDEFVSMASHELRTPLSIIIGAVKLVLDQIPGKIVPEQKEVLEMAMNNLGRLTRIVDAQLNISKIESGKIELHRTNIDIRGLIEETVGECRRQAEEKGIRLGFRVPEQPVDLCIDGDKIKQVLMNLISNGLKFTPAGGSIEVECKAEQKEVQLSVSDTGCGIAEQDMPRLFEKFAQFHRKVGPGEKGTGLGLAISRGIVKLHKGRIWAKSQRGKGTVFTFALPWLDSRDIVSELLEQAVRQAVKNNTNAGAIVMSVKAKRQEDEEQVQRVLKEVQDLVEQNLRRGVDKTVLTNPGGLVVVLADCDKNDAAAIKTRLEQTLAQYLVDKNLHLQVEPLIRYAVYPEDGHTTEELLEKVSLTDTVGSASSNP